MKQLITFLILAYFSLNTMAQESIHFEQLDGIPEFIIEQTFSDLNGDFKVITSPMATAIYDSVQTQLLNGLRQGINSFQVFGSEYLLADSRNFYLLNGNEIEILFSLPPTEINAGFIPSVGNDIYIATLKHVLRTSDTGQSFDTLAIFSDSEFIIQSRLHNQEFYSLVLNGSNIEFRVTDLDWNLLRSEMLDFEAYYFAIRDDYIHIPSSSGLYISNTSVMDFQKVVNKLLSNSIKYYGSQIVCQNQSLDSLFLINIDDYSIESRSFEGGFIGSNQENVLDYYNKEIILSISSLSPLRFDTIRPDVTATKVTDVHICDDILHTTTDENYYVLEDGGWVDYWRGGPGFGVDAFCNSYLRGGPDFLTKFNHEQQTYDTFEITIPISTLMVNFGDTTLLTGHQQCQELIPGGPNGAISADGGETWNTDIVAPPCFEQRYTTITDDRVYIYDRDQSYALAPGNASYSWFGYYDRRKGKIVMVEPDPSLPFVPQSSNQLGGDFVYFYVSPDETFYMNPVNSFGNAGYHSTDFGETWIPTPGVPLGRIYPTPDSLGTLVVQNSGPKDSPRFFVRYDATQPYEELTVTPSDLPQVDWLFYTSEGQMIIGNQSGFFHISDGITSAVEEVRAEQLGGLRVWPNPASKEITVQYSNRRIHEVRMYDLMSRLVWTAYVGASREATVDVAGLATGIYIVEAVDEKGERSVEQVVIGR